MTLPRTESLVLADGVRLDADVYVPAGGGRHPVLLMRQPYGRRIASTLCYAHPAWYAAQGFVVVIQDVRGRGTSEGVFRLFADDAEDGAATIAWAAALPESNGRVGMCGFSYQGTNQLLAASRAPAALRAIAPAMIGWDLRTDWAYQGGAFCLQNGLGWALQLAAESARRIGDEAAYLELRRAAAALPLSESVASRPAVMERHRALSHYHDWIDHPEPGAAWDAISPAAQADAIVAAGVPVLLVGGWYDTHLPGTLAAYRALAGRVPVKLVIGPWAHHPWAPRLAGQDFGEAAHSHIDELQADWFAATLGGKRPVDGVQLFDLGTLSWRGSGEWPRTERSWVLHGSGRASVDSRDGVLLPGSAATDDGVEHVVSDPWRPAPSLPPGTNRIDIDQRGDLLTFTGAPLERTLLLSGTVWAELFVTSDASDFDVSCTLSRVTLDGVWPVASGYRRVADAEAPVRVDMHATFVTLAPGDALRLSVAGAAFPAFPVNPGTGDDPTRARTMDARVITLRVRHGSRLIVGG